MKCNILLFCFLQILLKVSSMIGPIACDDAMKLKKKKRKKEKKRKERKKERKKKEKK